MTNRDTVSRLSCWLPFAALCLHIAEETPLFPEWATLRFGATSIEWFAISHVPVVLVAGLISWRAAHKPGGAALWWLSVFVAATFSNTLFHIGASVWWHEYSPGLISAVLLYVPIAAWLGPRLLRSIGHRQGWTAAACGALIAAAATASLWLDVPV